MSKIDCQPVVFEKEEESSSYLSRFFGLDNLGHLNPLRGTLAAFQILCQRLPAMIRTISRVRDMDYPCGRNCSGVRFSCVPGRETRVCDL